MGENNKNIVNVSGGNSRYQKFFLENTKDIPSSIFNKKFIVKRLKELGEKEGYKINDKFTNRLKDRIYCWYVDGDFILLRFICHRVCFREDIYKKCVLCKKEDNNIKHVINECGI